VGLIGAGLVAQTPAAGPQFEVASVKPAANDQAGGPPAMVRQMRRNNQPPGAIPMAGPDRVSAKGWSLLDLIAAAHSVRATQVSGPAWLSDQDFDVEAKVPDGTAKDELHAMLQSLLEERFGLKVHRSSQTGQGFALVVGKDGSKLTLAAPPVAPDPGLSDEDRKAQAQQKMQANLAAMRERSQEVGGLNSSSWSSITAGDLAAQLVRLAGAPVVDETGLTGKYSVRIETWTNSDVPGGTVFDAVEKLGLKLEPRKVTVETVVVDAVSKTATAN
jgi:uncharacterized protein (TIGR03435 family)